MGFPFRFLMKLSLKIPLKKKRLPKLNICFQNVNEGDDSREVAITDLGQDRR